MAVATAGGSSSIIMTTTSSHIMVVGQVEGIQIELIYLDMDDSSLIKLHTCLLILHSRS